MNKYQSMQQANDYKENYNRELDSAEPEIVNQCEQSAPVIDMQSDVV